MKTLNSVQSKAVDVLSPDGNDVAIARAYNRLSNILECGTTAAEGSVKGILEQLDAATPRASAYLPGLLAEPFHVTDHLLIEQVTFGNLCLDMFARAVDTATDKAQQANPTLIHFGSLCLGKAAQVYGELLPRTDGFWKYWEKYLREASDAERFLWRHRNLALPFAQEDFVKMGQKSALIKTSAAIYASLTGQWQILYPIEEGLVATASGVQIMDDLLDWEEDLNAGIYTYPLVLATQMCLPGESLPESLNSYGLVTKVLRAAVEKLQCGKRYFHNVGAISLVVFIDSLLQDIEYTKKHLHELLSPDSQEPEMPLIKHLRRTINPKLAH